MPIRMTGMVSGLDTDSIVKELVSAYSTKKEKYEKEQTKLGWKQESVSLILIFSENIMSEACAHLV